MEFIDHKIKEESFFRKNFLSDKNLFLVDFLQQKSHEPKGGFSKVIVKTKQKGTRTFQKRKNWHKIRDEVEKKRKLRSKVALGRSQLKEKQKQVHRVRSSKRAKQRQRIWSSWRYANHMMHNRDLKPSTEIQTSWRTTHQFNNVELGKIGLNLGKIKVKELERAGTVLKYNKELDQVSPKRSLKVDHSIRSKVAFPIIRPVQDPVLIKHSRDGSLGANVFVDSKSLGLIMSCCRSVQSWDVKIMKRKGQIFVDHKIPSRVTQISVNERARKQPTLNEKYKKSMNSAFHLENERTNLNKVFQQQILMPKKDPQTGRLLKKNMKEYGKLPFNYPGSKEVASKGYVYKMFTLPKQATDSHELRVVVRCEVDSLLPDGQTSINRAVHQFAPNNDPRLKDSTEVEGWEGELLTSPGTVIVNQVNDNSFEFSRWIFEALLSESKYLQIGFLTRDNFRSDKEHSILDIEKYETHDFARQFNVKLSNGWAIFKRIISAIMTKKDDDYLLMKIPNKQCLEAYCMETQSKKQKKKRRMIMDEV